MLEVVSWYIIALITHFLDCYFFAKFTKEKLVINCKITFLILSFSIIDCFLGVINGPLKIIITNLITFIILKIIYNKNTAKTLIGTFFVNIGYALSEGIYAVIFYLILPNIYYNKFMFEGLSGEIICNLVIFIIYFSIYTITPIVKLINNIINWFDEKKVVNILFNSILAIIIFTILLYSISFKILNNNEIIIVFAVLIGILVFVIGYFKQKSTNNKLSIEYSEMLDYSKTYEVEVEEKSKNQHEYKNQLILLDGMITSTNKKAKNYIKKLIDEENNINENDWMNKLKNLPNNGIKGFINFKIKKMINNNIVVCVNVDSKLSTKKYWKNFEDNLEKVSKVLGVYLDNAIEAASNSISKQIIIEFINTTDYIEFVLSNSYSGIVNYNEMDKQGYSTKGKGRGYGLSLAKDIINSSKILSSSREINGKFYVQKLYIKK